MNLNINQEQRDYLRELLDSSLRNYNISLREDGKLELNDSLKNIMRNIVLKKNQNKSIKTSLRKYFATEKDINPYKIKPKLIYFDSLNHKYSEIFKAAMQFWSTPVSHGYGRRLRFLVWDEGNNKLMGIIGLSDPIIGLKVRDDYIGWDKKTKEKRLYNVMSAYILGAVYPYNILLGAKLIALLATSKEVVDIFREKYENTTTYIRKENKIPELAMIDTMGAFGKSSIYNRLKGWKFIGYTKGHTHYHLSTNGFYEEIDKFFKSINHPIIYSYKYGKGSNWKIRVIKEAIRLIGLNPMKILNLGSKRAYYIAPLIGNLKDFLNAKTDKVERIEKTSDELFNYWKERWFPTGLKRFERFLEEGE